MRNFVLDELKKMIEMYKSDELEEIIAKMDRVYK